MTATPTSDRARPSASGGGTRTRRRGSYSSSWLLPGVGAVLTALAASGALVVNVSAAAHTVVLLDFEGVGNYNPFGNYYGGGGGGPAKDYGVVFGPGAETLVDADAGGSGNFANEPSNSTALPFRFSTAPNPT
jgi:hypothetical protein